MKWHHVLEAERVYIFRSVRCSNDSGHLCIHYRGVSVRRNVTKKLQFLLNHRGYRMEITCNDHDQKRAATSSTTDHWQYAPFSVKYSSINCFHHICTYMCPCGCFPLAALWTCGERACTWRCERWTALIPLSLSALHTDTRFSAG